MGAAATCLITFAALAAFAFSLARHHRQAFGRPPAPALARRLRLAGAALLILAPLPWIAEQGPAMALVAWLFCGTPVVGLAVVALFTTLEARRGR